MSYYYKDSNVRPPSKCYLFFRGDHFYPLVLENDEAAIADAKNNPGTTRVEDVAKKVIWEASKP
jgi:hypothetical protein